MVREEANGSALLYVDRQLVHEVTSPQAFDGLRLAGRQVRRPKLNVATIDHNVPTVDPKNIMDRIAKAQIDMLTKNCKDFGLMLYGIGDPSTGVVHIMAPELGLTLPGTTVVCGDSHTATHGAFGALAFGIGTSEVEHVLATQTLWQRRSRSMRATFTGKPGKWVTSKDFILRLIREIGTAGGTGSVLEYAGEAIRALGMAGRMTICNMSIEAGARAGMIAPDETTFEYIASGDRPYAPRGAALEKSIAFWKTLKSDDGAKFDREITIDTCQARAPDQLGHEPGHGGRHRRLRAGAERRADGAAGRRREGAGLHGPEAGHADDLDPRGRGVHRQLHERAHRGSARSRRRAEGPPSGQERADAGRAGLRAREGARRRPKGWTRSSPRPAPNGGIRAAACAWR